MRIITSRLRWWRSARAGLDPDDNDDDPEWLTPVGGDITSAVLRCVRTGSGVFVSVKEIWIWCVTCLALVAMLCIIWPVHGSIPKIYVCYSRMQNFENFYKNLIFIGKRFCRQQNCNVQILFSQEDDSITTKMTSVWRQREERK